VFRLVFGLVFGLVFRVAFGESKRGQACPSGFASIYLSFYFLRTKNCHLSCSAGTAMSKKPTIISL
jgi:hypothetical protein